MKVLRTQYLVLSTSYLVVLSLISCGTPLERRAYQTVVAAKAFLDSEKKQHPECQVDQHVPVCATIAKAVAAKDLLIDSINSYCAGPEFNSGGACNPPQKGTSTYEQAVAKLQSAIANYNQVASDLRALSPPK